MVILKAKLRSMVQQITEMAKNDGFFSTNAIRKSSIRPPLSTIMSSAKTKIIAHSAVLNALLMEKSNRMAEE